MNIHRLFGRGCCSVPDCIPVVQQFTPDPDDDPDEYPFVPGFEQTVWGVHWVSYRGEGILSPASYYCTPFRQPYSSYRFDKYRIDNVDARLRENCRTLRTLSFNDR